MTKDTFQWEKDCVLTYREEDLERFVSMCVCNYESFRSVQVLCISLGLGEQTDTDTPVAPKSALLSKPNDVKSTVFVCVSVCVRACMHLRSCNPYDCSVRNEGKHSWIGPHALRHRRWAHTYKVYSIYEENTAAWNNQQPWNIYFVENRNSSS